MKLEMNDNVMKVFVMFFVCCAISILFIAAAMKGVSSDTNISTCAAEVAQVHELEDTLDVCLTNLERVRAELHGEPDEVSNLERMRAIEQAIEDGTVDTLYPGLDIAESDY